MKHSVNSKDRTKDSSQHEELQPDWRSHRFANSAYRSAKQREFFSSNDVFNSMESELEFCDQMNLHHFLGDAK
jgi:hypothetical protein